MFHFKTRRRPSVRLNANLNLSDLYLGMQLTCCTDGSKATLVYINGGFPEDLLLIREDGELLTPGIKALLADYCWRGDDAVNPDSMWVKAAALFDQDRRILTRLGFRNHPLKIRDRLRRAMGRRT